MPIEPARSRRASAEHRHILRVSGLPTRVEPFRPEAIHMICTVERSLPAPSAGTRRSKAGRSSAEDDAARIARVCVGDMHAFEQLYKNYHPRLSRFLINLVRRPQLVEEILNETMMVVWSKPDSFNGASKLSTWIFAIAYRKAMKALQRSDEPTEDAERDSRVSTEASPEDQTGQHRLQALLAAAIAELSPTHRAVVELTYYHEFDYREIAEMMTCPLDTVKTRMFHARRHLKRKLSGELADWL